MVDIIVLLGVHTARVSAELDTPAAELDFTAKADHIACFAGKIKSDGGLSIVGAL